MAFTLMILFCFAAQVMTHEIKVNCPAYTHGRFPLPPYSINDSPTKLAKLEVEVKEVDKVNKLYISWAINIDVTIEKLNSTRIKINDETEYRCQYTPAIADANTTGLEEVWFHLLVNTSPGNILVQAANLPLPAVANGLSHKVVMVDVPEDADEIEPTDADETEPTVTNTKPEGPENRSKLVAIFAPMAGILVLASCFVLFKFYGSLCYASVNFSRLPVSSLSPVSVLLVYPAECAAFQKAVVALAEFLQEHGCSVDIDFWQQGNVAERGPLRWMAERAKSADRVMIICPQPSNCRSNHRHLGPSVPASASDLYPLVLNMVASHAKNHSELSKFWAVRLGKCQGEKAQSLPVELMACKSFSLMRDLDKLLKSLRVKQQDPSAPQRPGIFYSQKSKAKLQDAVGQLAGHQSSSNTDSKQFHSVVITA